MEIQASEKDVDFVSRGTSSFYNKQISCGIAHTNAKTHEIIRKIYIYLLFILDKLMELGLDIVHLLKIKYTNFPTKIPSNFC